MPEKSLIFKRYEELFVLLITEERFVHSCGGIPHMISEFGVPNTNKIIKKMMGISVEAYMEVFNIGDVKNMIDFYSSRTGKKLVDNQEALIETIRSNFGDYIDDLLENMEDDVSS